MTTKTRRRQAKSRGSTDPDNTATANELYDNGDAVAALKALQQQQQQSSSASSKSNSTTEIENYNHMLLSYMTNSNNDSNSNINHTSTMVKEMESWGNKFRSKEVFPKVSARKRSRNEWIAVYNHALLLLANGNVIESYHLCANKLRTMIISKKKPSTDISMVASRMAFLLLEGILANSLASHSGLRPVVVEKKEGDNNIDIDVNDLTAEIIVEWLEMQDPESYPEYKFLLALYKSRMDFAEREDETGKHVDSKIRSARKELKTAMEVFQHKLRPSSGGEESLASSLDADSDVNNIIAMNQQSNNNNNLSVVLQKQNQAALNLKANVEHLKGNPKKSLILCGEALTASTEEDPYYEAIHANNLALIYETNSRKHLANYTMAKALRVDLHKFSNTNFQLDGTARPDPTLVTLYNSALCSLQARNFLSAYECMHTCLEHSKDLFALRPRCWLLLAEACIGTYLSSEEKKTRVFRGMIFIWLN